MKLKIQLDDYIEAYETKDFIPHDPVRFAHRYNNQEDTVIASFIAAALAYGKREVFIEKLNFLFSEIMKEKPHKFIMEYNPQETDIKGFNYRFSKECDFVQFFEILNRLYSEHESIESLFKYSYETNRTVKGMFQGVVDYFYSGVTRNITQGFYHLLPNPAKNSAVKRLNMLMRWFVRSGEVDIGIWNFIDKSELLIPLDTHVAKISRKLGLLKRNANDFQSVIELTNELKKFDPEDPVKYDFALFGYGVNNKI